MKIITFLALISSASAFQVMQTKVSQTSLKMGMFDFKPMHGSGTGSTKDELDEQYRLQQEIVSLRNFKLKYRISKELCSSRISKLLTHLIYFTPVESTKGPR